MSARIPQTTALTVVRSNSRAYLTLARDVQKFLGSKPSAAWGATGWSAQSIAVPSTSERILPLLKSVELYLTTNPARENAALNLTTAQAVTLHTALFQARSAVNTQDVVIAQRKTERDGGEDKFRRRMRGLIDELTQAPISSARSRDPRRALSTFVWSESKCGRRLPPGRLAR